MTRIRKCLCDACGQVGPLGMICRMSDWTSKYKLYDARLCSQCVITVDGQLKPRPGGVPAARAARRVEQLKKQGLLLEA